MPVNKKLKQLTGLLVIKDTRIKKAQGELKCILNNIKESKNKIMQLKQEKKDTKNQQKDLKNRLADSKPLAIIEFQQADIYLRTLELKIAKTTQQIDDELKNQESLKESLKTAQQRIHRLELQHMEVTELKQKMERHIASTRENRVQTHVEEMAARRNQPPRSKTVNNVTTPSRVSPPKESGKKQPIEPDEFEKLADDFSALIKKNKESEIIDTEIPTEKTSQPQQLAIEGSEREDKNSRQFQSPHQPTSIQFMNTDAAPTQAPTPQVSDVNASVRSNDIASLIANQVQLMAVSTESTFNLKDPQLLLKLSDPTLDQTQLTLARTAAGWSLNATGASREQLQLLKASSSRLLKRFSESGLGEVSLTTELRGEDHAFPSR